MLAHVAQRGCQASILVDIQALTGHGPKQSALSDLALSRGLNEVTCRGPILSQLGDLDINVSYTDLQVILSTNLTFLRQWGRTVAQMHDFFLPHKFSFLAYFYS